MWLADPVFLRQTPQKSSQFAVLLLLIWVVAPLLLHLPPLLSMVFVLFWLLRICALTSNITALPRWLLFLLSLCSFGLVYLKLGIMIGREGGVALLVLMVMLKAFECRAARDWQVLLLAQLVIMGAVMLFDQSIWMAPWLLFSLFLFASVLGLLSGVTWRDARIYALGIIILSFPIMVLLFVTVPRRDKPLWHIPQPSSQVQAKTGLSDTLTAGSISNLIQSDELVFNAIFTDKQPIQTKDLYWRVLIMGQNHQGTWYAIDDKFSDRDRIHLTAQQNNIEMLTKKPIIHYQIIVKDEQGRIPVLDYPIPDRQQDLKWSVGDVARVQKSREGLQRISLQSVLSVQLPQILNKYERQFYTYLPDNINPKTQAFAKRMLNESHNNEDFIQRILAFFHNNGFIYTLNPQRNKDPDNRTDFFLFKGKEGFCEDYADAMVWMARSVGLPARIVTGYQGAEYHEQGNFWQVRSKNAHAWVEIWLPDKQAWQRVDPTAAVSANRILQGIEQALPPNEVVSIQSSFPKWNKVLQNTQFYWQQWVVNYDNKTKRSLLAYLHLSEFSSWFLSLLFLLILIIISLPLWLWLRRQKPQLISPLAESLLLLVPLLPCDEVELRTMGPEEIRQKLIHVEKMTPELNHLLDQYILWQYASVTSPSLWQQRRWIWQLKRTINKL